MLRAWPKDACEAFAASLVRSVATLSRLKCFLNHTMIHCCIKLLVVIHCYLCLRFRAIQLANWAFKRLFPKAPILILLFWSLNYGITTFLFFRHALDIREHYERKLERANNLYMELSAIMLQLEVREKELIKYVSLRITARHACGNMHTGSKNQCFTSKLHSGTCRFSVPWQAHRVSKELASRERPLKRKLLQTT